MERNRSQTDLLKADIDRLRDEQHACLTRKEAALQAELRGMHQQYAAHAEAIHAGEDYDNLDGQINEQLEALLALLPQARTED